MVKEERGYLNTILFYYSYLELYRRQEFLLILLIVVYVKICGNPDESRWNSLDPSGCSLAKVAGAEALAR